MDDTEESFLLGVDGKIYMSSIPAMCSFVLLIGISFGFDFGFMGALLSFPNDMITKPVGNFDANLYLSCTYLVASISACIITIFRIHTSTKMTIGGYLMIVGTLISMHGLMIYGRILFGIGIGIAFQVVATHASEIRYRRWVMTSLPRAISYGSLAAVVFFYGLRMITSSSESGRDVALWSLSYLLLWLGLYVDSIIDRVMLLFDDSSEVVENHHVIIPSLLGYVPARSLIQQVEVLPISSVFERKYLPPLFMAICISVFQQLTGLYAFMIYAPVLFKPIVLDEDASLVFSALMYLLSCIVMFPQFLATKTDKFSRRSLFVQGGIAMLLGQIIITFIVRAHHESLGAMKGWYALLLGAALFVNMAGFAWSWGPLGWLVPSEILPLKIQSVGYGLCVSMNMLCMFFVTQFFTAGLNGLGFGMHLVISSLVLFMTIFVYVLLPETKGVEVEDVSKIWKAHWFWNKFVEDDDMTASLV